jgi:hypothetical protein
MVKNIKSLITYIFYKGAVVKQDHYIIVKFKIHFMMQPLQKTVMEQH